jgi:IrrE N-terminal-like domain
MVVESLLNLIEPSVRRDLACEEPATAVELHFAPVRVRALPGARRLGEQCVTDGYYEASFDTAKPTIIHDAAVSESRAHFTILHELGHHLFATSAAHLLDDLDEIGGSGIGAQAAEERACHLFAAKILIPDDELVRVLPPAAQLLPSHLVELKETTRASWDAVAVRCVNWVQARVAVVLLRQPGLVSMSAASPRLGTVWWPHGSNVTSGGALSRAFGRPQVALKDTYRYDLAYNEQLFCDTLCVHDRLAIAVMSDKPSNGEFDILEPPTPSWQDREDFCAWDGDERDVGWCDLCHGQRCRTCHRCGCGKPRPSPICPGCMLPEPINPGSRFCRSCVLDGRDE